MKKSLLVIATLLCVFFSLLPITAAQPSVDFTEDGAARQASIYVAGNPDCLPVEYYDADTGTYKGAAPAFLSLASEKTGLSFVYIRAGEQDRRATLARNGQIDLMFVTAEETSLLELGVEKIKLFSVMKNGSSLDVYCVFTFVSGEKERAAICSLAENLTNDDIAHFFTTDNFQTFNQRRLIVILIVMGVVLLCTIAALTVFMLLYFRRNRKKEAFVDTATDIGNKKYFIQMFSSTISDQTRELYYIVYFAFAIDWVNSNYGTEESDNILKYTADTIKQRVKDNEFCARVGGGSFAAAIYSNGVEHTERRVEEILRVLNAYGEKYLSGDIKSLFHAGVCALAVDDKNAEKVLYNVEQAYQHAVKDKKDYVFVNHDVLNEYKTKVSIRELAGEALEKRAFTPYVQFIFNTKDGSICGGELLSRWETRLYGLLTPGSYIPILQDMGLIVRHDLLMLEEACKLLEQWQSMGKDYFLTCNLTRITISDQSLVEKVTTISGRYSFPKEKLIIEVTEGSIEEDKDSALRNIHSLKEIGFRIALDDFSTGYTAVNNLYEYTVDLVKIDRQMIIDAGHDSHAAVFMKEIAKLCHDMNIHVLAEGVENENQAHLVRSARCDYTQGYFYARALPLREIIGFEKSYKAKMIPESDSFDDDFETVSEPQAEEITKKSVEEPLRTSSSEIHMPPQLEEMPHNETTASDVMPSEVQKTNNDNNTIQIQYGPYRMCLPGNISMDPVAKILRDLQNKMGDKQ